MTGEEHEKDAYYRGMEPIWASGYPSVSSLEEVEEWYDEIGFVGGFRPFIDRMMAHESLNLSRKRILDFGCDNGIMLNYFDDRGLELHGCDLNEASLEKGRAAFPSFNLVKCPGLLLPYDDGHFDLIFASAVLKHIRHVDRPLIYDEFARVSDYLIVSEKNGSMPTIEEQHGFTFYLTDFISELKERFEELSLEMVGEHMLGLYRLRKD